MVATERERLRTQAMFLVGGSYSGETKKLIFKKIQVALEGSTIHLEELGISEEQWSNLEREFIEIDACLPAEKMSPAEAKDLAKSSGILWQQIKNIKDEDHKQELVDLLKKLWPRVNHAISTRLITHLDIGLKSPTEYFEIQALVHKDEKKEK